MFLKVWDFCPSFLNWRFPCLENKPNIHQAHYLNISLNKG